MGSLPSQYLPKKDAESQVDLPILVPPREYSLLSRGGSATALTSWISFKAGVSPLGGNMRTLQCCNFQI